MKYRILGSSGLRVSEMILGAMTFGEQGGVGAPLEECRRMIDVYAEAGGNVIDTAINYRGGQSEVTLGELLGSQRDQFVLATKYGVTRDGSDPNASGSHRKNLRLSLETSLRRLKTNYIDLYWLHIHDRHTPVDETMRALDDAVTAGKVLAVGISDTPAWIVSRAMTLAEWRGWAPFVGLQVEYSLLQRGVERELLPMAEAYGLTVAAWSPLGGGVLSGKFTGPAGPEGKTRIAVDSISEAKLEIARTVDQVAAELGVSSAQVAIAWVMSRSPLIHPMIGARTVDQLKDNLGALSVELTPGALATLDKASAIELGFPHDFNASVRQWVFGAADNDSVESRPVPRP